MQLPHRKRRRARQSSRRITGAQRTAAEDANLRSLQQPPLPKPTPLQPSLSKHRPQAQQPVSSAFWHSDFAMAIIVSSALFAVCFFVRRLHEGYADISSKDGVLFLTWVAYTAAWVVFAAWAHRENDRVYLRYFWSSLIVLGVAIVGTFLIL